ncbi:hypothetical protein SH661x_003148 [Planctomicrobium sp. SH661]|uniref:hypothetical protein n=1 Tax=Planctomicrobium sp. SH661 TaxID=3448124 RepID=UPI003F5BDF59
MTIIPIIPRGLPAEKPDSRTILHLSRPTWSHWSLIAAGLLLLVSAPASADVPVAERRLQLLQQRYQKLQEQFAKDMNALAQDCESQSYFKDAEEIRKRALPPESGAYDVDLLPTEPLPSIPLNLPDEERQWRLKLRKLETDYSTNLYLVARDALNKGFPSLAFQLIREVAFHNPDNRNARGMLGYVQDQGKWTTSFRKLMASKKMVDHPRFGWIEEKLVSRYENGERLLDTQWMSAEKEAAIRSDFKYAWEVGSEHFLVRTNHSLEKGVEISRALESFHDFFLREYTAFFNSPQQMQRLLDRGSSTQWNPKERYHVNYYRNKDEFVAALKARQPQIEKANGLYMPHDRIAYFYFDEQPDDTDEQRADKRETMYHEVTHQLLGESRQRTVDVGERANFWVIEGFPCYLESYRESSHEPHVGNPRHIRIYWARRRALEENIYWPMRQFTRLGKADFPLEPDAYNQAAGMAHFFLNYEDGMYRDGFIQYLSNVYDPVDRLRNSTTSLEQILGVKYEILDEQYRDYLKSLPSDPPSGLQVIEVRE